MARLLMHLLYNFALVLTLCVRSVSLCLFCVIIQRHRPPKLHRVQATANSH
jgi:hypothetical protein